MVEESRFALYLDMLTAIRLGDDPELKLFCDFDYIQEWALQLGDEVLQFWQSLKKIAGL